MRTAAAVLCFGLLLRGGGGRAEEPAKDAKEKAIAKAKMLVEERLRELKAANAQVVPITAEAVTKMFPENVFVVVSFRQWPVAIKPPAPLKSRNLFIVTKEGKLEHMTDAQGLSPFFLKNIENTTTREEAKEAVKCWLLLTQEFFQDGFYKFTLAEPRLSEKDGRLEIHGEAQVVPERGNKGEITVDMAFDLAAGRVKKLDGLSKVVPGIRPRCQATLLLHPDPLVRALAEDSLLVLGQAAREYLDEQRAKAGPELRRAIDRIWQRICNEGR
jgi:hypothetical protein